MGRIMSKKIPEGYVKFGKYDPIIDTKFARREGIQSGLTWPDKWKHVPGGPHVYSTQSADDKDWKNLCAHSKRNNKAWLQGWHLGFESRHLVANKIMTVDEAIAFVGESADVEANVHRSKQLSVAISILNKAKEDLAKAIRQIEILEIEDM